MVSAMKNNAATVYAVKLKSRLESIWACAQDLDDADRR